MSLFRALLADAKVSEHHVQQLLHVHAPSDASHGIHSEAKFLCGKIHLHRIARQPQAASTNRAANRNADGTDGWMHARIGLPRT